MVGLISIMKQNGGLRSTTPHTTSVLKIGLRLPFVGFSGLFSSAVHPTNPPCQPQNTTRFCDSFVVPVTFVRHIQSQFQGSCSPQGLSYLSILITP